ncbi:MAG: YdcH family protein [Arenicellales bacterium WSBS_2016_MAG_OTU3]
MSLATTGANSKSIQHEITRLQTEHRDLDEMLGKMANNNSMDELQLTRLKKRKLHIKDSIERLQSQLLPNMIA